MTDRICTNCRDLGFSKRNAIICVKYNVRIDLEECDKVNVECEDFTSKRCAS